MLKIIEHLSQIEFSRSELLKIEGMSRSDKLKIETTQVFKDHFSLRLKSNDVTLEVPDISLGVTETQIFSLDQDRKIVVDVSNIQIGNFLEFS